MQRVLKSLEAEPVGIAHLRRSCPAYVRVIEYDRLPKKGSIAQVFGAKYKALIVLYEFHDSKHRTGISLSDRKNCGEGDNRVWVFEYKFLTKIRVKLRQW